MSGDSTGLLRAMAENYKNGHQWDRLDGEVVTEAAGRTEFALLGCGYTFVASLGREYKDINFATADAAVEWMTKEVDDPYQDTERLAFIDNSAGLLKYEELHCSGCCGFFDELIQINGKAAVIGCNYGH